MSNWLDAQNAFFELIGAAFVWSNVWRIRKDKCVWGVNLSVTAVYCLWGVSSLTYYASLGHWLSFFANVAILTGNATWLAHALAYRRRGAR